MARQNGIKFTRPGSSVDTVADYDSYFYTGWPWLKIAGEGVVTVGSKNIVIDNPTGYPCFYMVYGKSTGLREYGHSVNSNSLTLNDFGFYPTEDCHYYIFALPLKIPYTSDKVNLSGQRAGTASEYGIRYNPTGLDSALDKTTPIDSDFRSPLVHAVIASANYPLTVWTGSGIEYKFDLPYQPALFGFSSNDNENYTMVTTAAQTPPKLIYPGVGPWAGSGIRSGSVIVSGTASMFSSLVILKNPYDLGVTLDVNL